MYSSYYYLAILLLFFILLPTTIQAQISFGSQEILSTNADGAYAVYAADLDSDGDLDVISASSSDDKIAWYENLGAGNFGAEEVIATNANFATEVTAADIDGDGDIDVIAASEQANKISWFRNDGEGFFDEEIVVTLTATEAQDVVAGDIDADGWIDLAAAARGSNTIAWYRNGGGGVFLDPIDISANALKASAVDLGDMDNDGDLDVLSASRDDNKVAWYEASATQNFNERVISTAISGASDVLASDLDVDGDLDILATSYVDNKVVWFENLGFDDFGPEQVITTDARGASAVFAVDLDGDGIPEVLSASALDDKIAYYQRDTSGVYGPQQVISNNDVDWGLGIYAADLNNDDAIDVLTASLRDDKVAWFPNLTIIPMSMELYENNPTCFGTNTGSFLVQLSGTRFPVYEYSWVLNGGEDTGQGTSETEVFVVSGLAAGTYDFQVINQNQDTVSQVFEVTGIPGSVFEVTDITTTNSTNQFENGGFSISTTGGIPDFTYTWSGPDSGEETNNSDQFSLVDVAAGDYTITITDFEGKTVTKTITILDETAPVSTCERALDIVIMNDVSGSVDATEYRESKEFFVDFVEALNIGTGSNDSRAAIVEWANPGEEQLAIPITGNLSELQKYETFNRSTSGGTHPVSALFYGYDYLEEFGRSGAVKVIILSTDASEGQVSPSLINVSKDFQADGYIVLCIAFDSAFSNNNTQDILRQVASRDILAPGAPAYSQLNNTLAENIVNLHVCPSDPGSSNTVYFERDGAIEINSYTPIGACDFPEAIQVEFTVTAQQQLSLPAGMPITFYYNNPEIFGSTPILSTYVSCALAAGESETITVNLPVTNPASVWVALNDDGSQSPPINFPVTNIEEGIFVNNIDQIEVCIDPVPTIAANKYTTTPKPVCDNRVFYTVDICNIGSVNATDVQFKDLAPTGFALIDSTINLNGCAQGASAFSIPVGCCMSITYQYDATNATDGVYNNQGVQVFGPPSQISHPFNGAETDAEDVTIGEGIECASNVVRFTKEVSTTSICEESFVTYAFTIVNETNIALQGIQFTDILASPATWGSEPFLAEGLVITGTNIANQNTADFTIAEIAPETTATFYIDAYMGDWESTGTLNNTATLSNFPDFINGDGADLSASSQAVTVNALPTIEVENIISVPKGSTTVDLSANIINGDSPTWQTSGDGTFSDPNTVNTTYTLGATDIENEYVTFTITAESTLNNCGSDLDTMRLVFICEQPPAPTPITNNYEICQNQSNSQAFELDHETGTSIAWFDTATPSGTPIAFGADHIFETAGTYYAATFLASGLDTCYSTETSPFSITERVLQVQSSGNQNIVQGEAALISVSLSNLDPANYSISWNVDSLNNIIDLFNFSISPSTTTTYTATFQDAFGCTTSTSITIDVRLPNITPLLPSAFSPNNDGINDVFQPLQSPLIEPVRLQIYNRWGELLYDHEGPDARWNGTYQNTLQPMGVYVYWYEYIHPEKGLRREKGNMTLIY